MLQSIATDWDADDNLLSATETYGWGSRTTTHGYDVFDRLTSVTDTFGGTTSYTYDPVGNRTTLTAPDHRVTSYTYDALNRLSSVDLPGTGTVQPGYDRSGLLKRLIYPNRVATTFSHDQAGRVIIARTFPFDDPDELLLRFEYLYDRNGNRVSQGEQTLADGSDLEHTTYTYDDADRLLTITYPDQHVAYTLDVVAITVSRCASVYQDWSCSDH